MSDESTKSGVDTPTKGIADDLRIGNDFDDPPAFTTLAEWMKYIPTVKLAKETFSINNRLILEPYGGDRALKEKVKSGFATLSQKSSVVGLKVLMTCQLENRIIPKGYTAFIKEEYLFTQPWAKAVLESPAVEGQFIIVDLNFVEFLVTD